VWKILIVDDDSSGTQLLTTLLVLEGYQPLALENWQNPIEDVVRHRPDLVVMDVYLRIKNGLELLAELRAHVDSDVARTPVLMMSAEDNRQRSEQAGANGFLEKPFGIQAMVDVVEQIMKGGMTDHQPEPSPK
jgi:DNA-binding response OmpR family regulator